MTREEAITILDCERPYGSCGCGATDEEIEESINMAIKALEQEPVLDKIRSEIEQTAKDYDKFDDYRRVRGLWIALEIIDKYKAESEVE